MVDKHTTCKCSEFAPLMSKYMNTGEDIKVVGREKYEVTQGHLPNFGRKLTTTDGAKITLVQNANDREIVKENYTSPISLGELNLKTGEVRVLKLEIDSKTGEAKLVPLEIDPKTGEAKYITLDVNHKTGQAQIVKLEVDEKTGESKLVGLDVAEVLGKTKLVELDVPKFQGKSKIIQLDAHSKEGTPKLIELATDEKTGEAKLVNLDVPELTGEAKVVLLNTYAKEGTPKLIELATDEKTGEAKLIPLHVESKNGNSYLVTLDIPTKLSEAKIIKLDLEDKESKSKLVELKVDEKTKDSKLVHLEVDPKIGEPKLIVLEIDEKTKEPKLIDLNVTPIEGNTKLVALNVNPITGETKLIKLEVPEIESEAKLVKLTIDKLSGEIKLVRLDIPEKTRKPKLVGLEVEDKTKDPVLVRLEVDPKTGKSILVPLDTNDKRVLDRLNNLKSTEGYIDPIDIPNYIEKTGTPKLVMLEIDPKTGEPKLVKLDITTLTGTPKLVMLEVDPIYGEAKLIMLDVPEIKGEAKLVMLEVDPKTGTPKLVMLEIDPKTGEPKLIMLDVPEKTKDPVLVRLEVDPKTSEAKLIKLDVPELTGEVKLIRLDVEPKSGEAKLVLLDVEPKSGEAKLVKLSVTPKTGQVKVVELEIPELADGQVKVVELKVDEKTKEPTLILLDASEGKDAKITLVELEVKPIELPEGEVVGLDVDKGIELSSKKKVIVSLVKNEGSLQVMYPKSYRNAIDLPDDEGVNISADKFDTNELRNLWKYKNSKDIPDDENLLDLSDKYDGDYIPGTNIPRHYKTVGSVVSSAIKVESTSDLTKLDGPTAEKYRKTAAWMEIPGKLGLQAAKDYESIINTYDLIDFQLGGGNAGIERIKSYITAAVSGKGLITEMPHHILESGHILSGSSIVRSANAGIRSVVGGVGGGVAKAISGTLSALNGDITGALKSISGSKGGAKAKAIHEALVLVNNLYSRLLGKTETRPDQLPGSSSLGGTTAALLQGNVKGSIKSAVGGVVNKLLGVDNRDPINAPKNKKDGLWEGEYSKTWEDPKSSSKASGLKGLLNTLGITSGSSGGDYGYTGYTASGESKTVKFSDRMKTPAMSTTLKELISTDPNRIGSLSDLRAAIQGNNSVITTFSHNLNSRDKGSKSIGNIGLDSNHNWEVTLEPLIDKTLNGGFTYIPSMSWINKQNESEFGIKTDYGRWIPFTSFELQDKKLTSKSLSLFDGGITYPVSMEFTNELRLTLIDDQLKTFRRYFDTVAKVSTFRSNQYRSVDSTDDPKVLESSPEVACYKNVTFLCTIYVLNGEYATVKRYPLLVTLADYQIEYTGEVGEGGNDMALHFSIVGSIEPDDLKKISSYHRITKNELFKSKINNSLPSYTTKNPLAKIAIGLF